MSAPGSRRGRRDSASPGQAPRAVSELSGACAHRPRPLRCCQACVTAGLAADLAIGSCAPAGVGSGGNGGREPVRLGAPGVRPVVQGVGILSVPGGLVLSGHPGVGVVFLSLAAGFYGLVLLSALFGSAEISRRGFRLLGMAEDVTRSSRGQVSPLTGHVHGSRGTCLCNRPVVIVSDVSRSGRKR